MLSLHQGDGCCDDDENCDNEKNHIHMMSVDFKLTGSYTREMFIFQKKNKQTCVFVFVRQAVRWKIRSPVFVFMIVFVHVPVFGINYACICVTSRAMENKTS